MHDNPALSAARASSDRVYAVYCLSEMNALNESQRGFVVVCLRELRAVLAKRDATLSLCDGEPPSALLTAARRLKASAVYCGRAYNKAEAEQQDRVARSLENAGILLHVLGGNVIHEPEAVAQRKQAPGEGYRVFPPFLDAWKSLGVSPALREAWPNGFDDQQGALPDMPAPSPLRLIGGGAGEASAVKALQTFAASRVADYSVNAEYPARNGSSHLGAALRFGCLSARTLYHAVAERMARSWTLAQEKVSMEFFFRRLAMRDFFTHLAYFAPELHELELQEKMRGFPQSRDTELTRLWELGATGYPFVDAAMRQLHREGYVHQRAATCAASFCCFDLGLDWRAGRDVWMRKLVAADQALCDGNWQLIAGVGSDQAAFPRIYNPVRQARQFDAQAAYVRRYCSELAKLPTSAAAAPWELARQQQIELGFFTPDDYPEPIVDHELAARKALARYQRYRNRRK